MNPLERWRLADAAGMRRLDRFTIETLGVPGELLMESAGRAVAGEALALGAGARGAFVVAGAGNNGGDGLVAARHLHVLGVRVRVAVVGDVGKLRGDAAANLARARASGVPFVAADAAAEPGEIVIDALFGTGLDRAVAGEALAAIERMAAARRAGSPILAVDVPSGLSADTGQPLGAAVEADVTLALGQPKLGLALEPGRSLSGRVHVAKIGIVEAVSGEPPAAELWTRAGAGRALPQRPAAGHKGAFGHVLVIAGSEGKTGAAALAALGAARIGAGLVTIACPAGLHDLLAVKCTESMTVPVPDTPGRALSASAEKPLLELGHARDVVALGPGIGGHPETVALVDGLLAGLGRPLVLDADGLNALGRNCARLKARSAPTILTPHPGEAARLLGIHAQEINADRVGAARALAQGTGAVVVLKGAATVTASPEGRVAVNPTGGPVLGTGGTGDVLAGTIAGLLAQGCEAFEAAALGVFVHGLAGDLFAARRGESGALAGEVAGWIPEAMASLRREAGPAPGERRADDGSGDPVSGRSASVRSLSLPFPEP